MKLFLCILSVTLVLGDKLENIYLPPSSARTAGGTGSFLLAPQPSLRSSGSPFSAGPANSYVPPASGPVSDAGYGPSSGQHNTAASRSSQSFGPQFRILKSDSQNPGDGSYTFEYETENQISQHESGEIKNGAGGEEGSSVVRGSYSYTAPNGQQITVNYIADENGFRPEGEHIPTPPSIPAEIQKSLTTNTAFGKTGGYSYQSGSGSPGVYEGVEINSAISAAGQQQTPAANRQYLAPTFNAAGSRNTPAVNRQYLAPSFNFAGPQNTPAANRQYLAPSFNAAGPQNTPAVNRQYLAPSFSSAGPQNTPAINRQYLAPSFGAAGQQNSVAVNRQYVAPAVNTRGQQNRQYLAPAIARTGQENGGYRY